MKLRNKWIGNNLQIKDHGNHILITWRRMSALELALYFIFILSAIVVTGSYFNWYELLDTPLPKMSSLALIIFWSIWSLIGLHLFFNRKSVVRIDVDEFIFKKRRFIFTVRKYPTRTISKIELKEQNNRLATDSPFTFEIYKLYVLFNTNQQIKLDSFNKEDCDKIQKAVEAFTKQK